MFYSPWPWLWGCITLLEDSWYGNYIQMDVCNTRWEFTLYLNFTRKSVRSRLFPITFERYLSEWDCLRNFLKVFFSWSLCTWVLCLKFCVYLWLVVIVQSVSLCVNLTIPTVTLMIYVLHLIHTNLIFWSYFFHSYFVLWLKFSGLTKLFLVFMLKWILHFLQ